MVALHLVDHCRIGSLEMEKRRKKLVSIDHCRIGSLEIVESQQSYI